ncbi:hypothetical protein IFM89_036037 [Coptis chinensis]|uniref:Pentatricopeptide repeat-containing protein n=1 Tax=Coptis chinensis TaxID=261450 RepID=A0A835H928_9MAGN|nr:hypothetical protein IFM89_036037 [Coptis chinensis]
MWALRRTINPCRGYHVGAFRACGFKLDTLTNDLDHAAETCNLTQFVPNGSLSVPKSFYETPSAVGKLSFGSRGLSSQAGAESSGDEDDLEDGFSELETPLSDVTEDITAEEDIEDLISEPELSGEDDILTEDPHDEHDIVDTKQGVSDGVPPKKAASSDLLKVILIATRYTMNDVLDKWLERGNTLNRNEISLVMLNLRKRRFYGKALQFSEWLEKKRTFDERDYASRLDLIAKVLGLYKAEAYVKDVPESFRGEVLYRTLLANCVVAGNKEKAEDVFNKMKKLELQITSFACNQLLLLYKRLDKKKIADVLKLMELQNIRLSAFTYRLLIDARGQANDIEGMEKCVETMKEDGFEPDMQTQGLLVRHYVTGGFTEKAEAILKEMEGTNLKENRWACRILLPLYADLGMDKEVGRIWKICDPNPHVDECLAAIEAWGKVGKVEEAEAVFDRMTQTWKKLSSRNYTTLLKVYANHKMLTKGKDLAKRRLRQYTALLDTYVKAKVPAYGFRDRMKGDNIFPNKPMQAKLAKVDAFRKTAISDILD